MSIIKRIQENNKRKLKFNKYKHTHIFYIERNDKVVHFYLLLALFQELNFHQYLSRIFLFYISLPYWIVQ